MDTNEVPNIQDLTSQDPSKHENQQSHQPIIIKKGGSSAPVWILVILLLILGATLPFHYIPSRGMIFPKNSLTFSYTIITEDDINTIISRYNKASLIEMQAINNEPVVRKLMEQGIIVSKESTEDSYE